MKLFTAILFTIIVLFFNVTDTRSSLYNGFPEKNAICLFQYRAELPKEQLDSINFLKFMKMMAFKESSNRPTVINRHGYLGLYQMGGLALKDVGYSYNFFKDNLSDVDMQNEAFIKLCKINGKRLDKYIQKHSGRYINGVKVTASGIISAAHLLGARSVKNFLDDAPSLIEDANGTHLLDYMKFFQDINVDYIIC